MQKVQILTVKEKTFKEGEKPKTFKGVMTQADEAGTGRIWSFAIVWLDPNPTEQSEFLERSFFSLMRFFEEYEILKHEEILMEPGIKFTDIKPYLQNA